MKENARKIFQENLKYYMKRNGIDQSYIASSLNLTASTVSDWVTGKNYPRVNSMQKLSDLLGVRMSQLTDKNEFVSAPENIVSIHSKQIPLIGGIAAGEPILAEQQYDTYVEADCDLHCDYALRVDGDSMEPTIKYGDVVFIRQQDDVNDGQIAAVLLDDSATLKRITHIPNGLILISDNVSKYPPRTVTYPEFETIRILGKAVAFKRLL